MSVNTLRMDTSEYFVIDIETCPLDLDNYEKLTEEERKKLINPIDSKIIAIGIRHKDKNIVFQGDDEKKLLEDFWLEWKTIKKGSQLIKVVGYNIKNFDLPFLVSKSFINNVTISSFFLKEIIDLFEKVNAFRYGNCRGTLKEYSTFMGIPDIGMDGSGVADLYKQGETEKIKSYLENDLFITDKMYIRMKELNILQIERW